MVNTGNGTRLRPGLSIEETAPIGHGAGTLFSLSLRGASATKQSRRCLESGRASPARFLKLRNKRNKRTNEKNEINVQTK